MSLMNNLAFSFITIHGADSDTFLQGQLTCDINKISPNHAQLAACCDLKGRVVASFFLIKMEHESIDYLAYLPADNIDNLLSHLNKYAVFSKVELKQDSSWQAQFDTKTPDASGHDCLLPNSNNDYLKLSQSATPIADDETSWLNYLNRIGLCFVTATLSGKFLPMMLNYDQLGGIDFEKGCYLGQEVIARAHYRGKVKRRLHQLEIKQASKTIHIGDSIQNSQGETIGTVTLALAASASHYVLWAVIQDQALSQPLQIDGDEITAILSRP